MTQQQVIAMIANGDGGDYIFRCASKINMIYIYEALVILLMPKVVKVLQAAPQMRLSVQPLTIVTPRSSSSSSPCNDPDTMQLTR